MAYCMFKKKPNYDLRRGGLSDGHLAMNSFIGIPIEGNNGMIGMIGLANKQGGYSEEDVDFLNPFLMACYQIILGYRKY